MDTKQKHKLIFSTRIAKQIIKDGKYISNLVDIHENRDDAGRSVFVFKETEDFNLYLKEEFNII